MYSTCLYCTRDLDRNDVLETLPVGRRVAFDPAAGRLWVICPACAKWNLVPFDTRLETIDACEQLFRDTKLRFSTDNIGVARLRAGLDLVRIGPALRPEFAAWRYGDRFASRRRRNITIAATLGAAGVGGLIGLHALIPAVIGVQLPLQGFRRGWEHLRVATRLVPAGADAPLTLTVADIQRASLRRVDPGGEAWGVAVPNRVGGAGRWLRPQKVVGSRLLTGPDAVHALGAMLPLIGGRYGSAAQVRDAVGLLETHSGIDEFVVRTRNEWVDGKRTFGKLAALRAERRLALEMLAHEESERQWLQGELKLLERQWREADQLAKIADGMAVEES